MNVYAICSERWRRATEAAAGVTAVTSPDWNEAVKADVIYINLIGKPKSHGLFDENGVEVIKPDDIKGLDLKGKIVYVEAGHVIKTSIKTRKGERQRVKTPRMLGKAFLDAGAIALIGSASHHYGHSCGAWWDSGRDRMFHFFLLALPHALDIQDALYRAKRTIKIMANPITTELRVMMDGFYCIEGKQ